MRSPNGLPLSTVPLRNWAPVHADATVVNSLIVPRSGGDVPNVAIGVIAGFAPLTPPTLGAPPLATM